MRKIILLVFGFICFSSAFSQRTSTIVAGASPFQDSLWTIDTSSYTIVARLAPSLSGFTVTGINGLATNPITGEVFAILKVSGATNRILAKINITTGVCTLVGGLGDKFSTLAFNANGSLFGVTGNGAAVPETMFRINTTDATTTLFRPLGNGADGEIIAFCPANNKFYHWSGNGTVIWERFDTTGVDVIENLVYSGSPGGETFGALYLGNGRFLVSNISSQFHIWDTLGNISAPFASLPDDLRGLVMKSCVSTITAGGPTTFCNGSSVLLTATSGTNYQWYQNGGAIGGANSSTLTVTTSGIYNCIFKDPCGITDSIPTGITVTVNPVPQVDPVSNQAYCAGAAVPSTVFTSSTAGATFSWSRTGEAIGLGTNSGSGNVPAFTATNSGITPLVCTFSVVASYTNNGVTCTGTPIQFTITINPTPGISPATSAICPGGVQQLFITAPQTFSSATLITIPNPPSTGTGTGAPANPYPSTINVSGLPTSGVIVKSITINGVTHTFPSDIDVVLQSPTGTNVILMSDAGGGTAVSGVNLTFSDAAASNLATPLVTGTFKPTNISTPDNWPAPGPGSLTQATPTIASFGSGNPNGNWSLYVVDDAGGDVGSFSGWSITFDVPSGGTAIFSPTTGLYTDAGATIAYTGTAVSTVYASPTSTTTYSATMGSCPSSNNATVTFNPATSITSQPTDPPMACAGSTVIITVGAGGVGLTYQWQVDPGTGFVNVVNGGVYSNATTASLTITGVTAAMNNYKYKCVVTGTCGSATSNFATLTVDQLSLSSSATPPSLCEPAGAVAISGTASNGVLTPGGDAIIASSGTINLAIPDNTAAGVSSSITMPAGYSFAAAGNLKLRLNLGHSWAGDLKVTLTSPCGVTTVFDRPGVPPGGFGNSDNFGTTNAGSPPAPPSDVYIFDIAAGTVIPETSGGTGFIAAGTYQPSDINGVAHNWSGLTFPCAASGTWTLNISDNAGGDIGVLTDWAIIGPAVATYNHTLTGPGTITQLPSTGLNNSTGNFSVTGLFPGSNVFTYTSTDSKGCSVSNSVTVTVNPKPSAVIAPAAVTICNGNSTTLKVDTTRTFTSNTLITIPNPPSSGTGTGAPSNPYPSTIAVSGMPTTGVFVRSVTLNGISHTFPSDIDVVLQSPTGTNVILMSDAGGGTTVSGVNLTFSDAAASNLATPLVTGTFKPTNISTPDNWPAPGPGSLSQTTPTLSSFNYRDPNGNWNLYVVDDAGGDIGSMTGWSITFGMGTANITYTWSPATGLNVTTGPVVIASPATTTTYTVTATSSAGCINTGTSTVTVNQLPTITVQPTPATQTICPGFPVTYTVTATGTGITYQWRKNGVNLANGGFISGVTTNTLTISSLQLSDAGNYDVVVSGVCPPAVTSNPVTLNVGTVPTITTPPANTTVCEGSNASFSVVATALPPVTIYQWQVSTDGGVNFSNITGFTSTLTLTNVTLAMNNNRYRCIVTSQCGFTATSSAGILTVSAKTIISIASLPPRICIDDTLINLSALPVGGVWSGIGILGNTFLPYRTAVGSYTLTYTYTNASGCVSTPSIVATVLDCPERERLLGNGGVLLYPNPNNGRFNLRVNSNLYNYLSVKVYNAAGAIVNGILFSRSLTPPTYNGLAYGRIIPINLSYLPAGIYNVNVYYDDGARTDQKTFKVVIAH